MGQVWRLGGYEPPHARGGVGASREGAARSPPDG